MALMALPFSASEMPLKIPAGRILDTECRDKLEAVGWALLFDKPHKRRNSFAPCATKIDVHLPLTKSSRGRRRLSEDGCAKGDEANGMTQRAERFHPKEDASRRGMWTRFIGHRSVGYPLCCRSHTMRPSAIPPLGDTPAATAALPGIVVPLRSADPHRAPCDHPAPTRNSVASPYCSASDLPGAHKRSRTGSFFLCRNAETEIVPVTSSVYSEFIK